MKQSTLKYGLLLLTCFCAVSMTAQKFKFRHYNEDDGLTTSFVYSINQDENGFLLVGTDEGLYRFDGFEFKAFYESDSLAENFVRCSFEDSKGRFWYGHDKGHISIYENGIFTPISLEEHTTSRINGFTEDPNGNIWVVTQNDGLVKLDEEFKGEKYYEGLEEFSFYNLYIYHDVYWIGTDFGLIRATFDKDHVATFDYIDEILETLVSDIEPCKDDHCFLVATEDAGLFKVDPSEDWRIHEVRMEGLDLTTVRLNSVFEHNSNGLWLASNNRGILHISNHDGVQFTKLIDYGEGDLIGTNSVHTAYFDREGNLWMGTIGNGLVKLVDNYFSFYSLDYEGESSQINSIQCQADSIVLGTSNGVVITERNPDAILQHYGPDDGLPDAQYSSVCIDDAGTLWVGSADKGLYYKTRESSEFQSFTLGGDLLSQRINSILGTGKMLWVATDFGLYQLIDMQVKSHFSMQGGLPHNVVEALYQDSKGRIWIGTHNNEITYIEGSLIKNIALPSQTNIVDVTSFVEDDHGSIWIGTNGAGVVSVDEQDSIVFRRSSGLLSDYCYSLVCDSKNRIWVGHRGGLSRIDYDQGKIDLFDPGQSSKIDFMPNALFADAEEILWFGTNAGLLRYDHRKDVVNEIEPALNIRTVNISDSLYASNEPISLPYGDYKLQFDFVGISLKRAEQVTYKYILEGHDPGWSEITSDNQVKYSRLGPGEYTFKVTSFNSDGVGGNVLKEIQIRVDKPFWGKWWFFVTVALVLFFTIRWFVIRRERIMRQNQEYLQTELAARTREVVEQKELLEIKNKDITDSIVYAKNIQKAMLPEPDRLTNMFDESFVFFKPRDIVSGDFYWVEQFGDNTIIACADCTGHGVPGAFMSLIGSALLKEVARMSHIDSPDVALNFLDRELRQMLNRDDSEFGVEDGMDISIVEFNKETGKIRAASAKRPIVIYKADERFVIKGDRYSIGGSYEGDNKQYSLHEMTLNQGDSIYQFSDGFADQFGGERGKKLKKNGLLEMLDNLVHLEMTQQGRLIRQKFFEWKGSFPQVDDVIMVGVRL